jgi:hypothetical protein
VEHRLVAPKITPLSFNCDLSINPETVNKQSDRKGRPELNRQIRLKSILIPDLCNRSDRSHSRQESRPQIVILLGSSAISAAVNKIFDGTIIDKESPLKRFVSIRFNRDSGSNEIDESDLQEEKHDGPGMFNI